LPLDSSTDKSLNKISFVTPKRKEKRCEATSPTTDSRTVAKQCLSIRKKRLWPSQFAFSSFFVRKKNNTKEKDFVIVVHLNRIDEHRSS